MVPTWGVTCTYTRLPLVGCRELSTVSCGLLADCLRTACRGGGLLSHLITRTVNTALTATLPSGALPIRGQRSAGGELSGVTFGAARRSRSREDGKDDDLDLGLVHQWSGLGEPGGERASTWGTTAVMMAAVADDVRASVAAVGGESTRLGQLSARAHNPASSHVARGSFGELPRQYRRPSSLKALRIRKVEGRARFTASDISPVPIG